MRCPECGAVRITVYRTYRPDHRTVERNRRCEICDTRWRTVETLIRTYPPARGVNGRFHRTATLEMIYNPETLVDRCVQAYWTEKLATRGIHSRDRMAKVFEMLADEIKGWAPPEEQARICHLAITEVADRLKREARPETQPAACPAPSASAAP